jgi:hypothetical protein
MSKMFGRREFGTILSIVTMGAALCFASGTVRAEDSVSDEQILQALTPAKKPPLTRGLSVGPQTPEADPTAVAAQAKFVQTIRGRATRSLSATEREEIATIAKTKPNIDLEITFNYNLAEISQNLLPSVQALGRALTNADRRVQVVNMKNKTAEAASPEAGASRSLAGRFVPELMSSR